MKDRDEMLPMIRITMPMLSALLKSDGHRVLLIIRELGDVDLLTLAALSKKEGSARGSQIAEEATQILEQERDMNNARIIVRELAEER